MICWNLRMDKYEQRRTTLQALVDELGRGGIASIAQQIGKDASYVSRMLYPPGKSGAKRIGEDTAEALARAYPTHFAQHNSEGLSTPIADDLIRIPLLANCGSMGPGNEALDADYVVGDLALSSHWINQHIRPGNIRELKFIHAHGESMAPTFSDGDVLLVDVGSRDPSSMEGVYVLEVRGQLYIKRVRIRMDGAMEVSSDNINIKTVDVLNGDHQLNVLGRVVWAWNGKKL